jgi:7,8-dihydropterin-6-yl-methyl-4-(beta-D-ribofuranosyl)aminobenzene 5'-phosphate synthase
MTNGVSITVLVDNSAGQKGLVSGHGLSLFVQVEGRRLVFDSGFDGSVVRNAAKLGVELEASEAVVVSHGHYDHTGGLVEVLDKVAGSVYLHPQAVGGKYSGKGGGCKYIGMGPKVKDRLLEREVVWTQKAREVLPGVIVTGEVERVNAFEDTGGSFYIDSKCSIVDGLVDDQSLVIDTKDGLIVVTGCAHSGIVNILDHISGLMDGKRVLAVIGGLHLVNASDDRIARTIAAFERYDVRLVVPMHCTGERAVKIFEEELADKCLIVGTGARVDI